MSHPHHGGAGAAALSPSRCPRPGQRAGSASWAVLALLCGAQLMTVVDGTVVNVALPTISRVLSFGADQVQWVVTAYLLGTGGAMLLAGHLADRFGRRRMLLAGIAIFAAASLLSGSAPDMGLLIAARGAQGAGAALLSPAALSIITTTFTGARQARALSTWGAISAGGFVAGLLIGGVITTELGWRWIFFINAPLSALLLASVPLLVTRDDRAPATQAGGGRAPASPVPGNHAPNGQSRSPAPRVPLAGAVALTAGLVAIVYAIGAPHGWGSAWTLGSLGAGLVLLAAFAVADRRTAHPMLAPALLRSRSLVTGSILMLAVTGLLGGTLFVTTFVLQQQLHASALRTGLDYLPFAVTIGLAAHLAPRLLSRIGTRATACAGLAMVAAGELVLAATAGHSGYAAGLLPAFLILGAGVGLTLNGASVAAMAEVPPGQAGAASGLFMTGHETGGALGVAVLSAVAAAAGRRAGTGHVAAGHVGAGWQIAAGHGPAFTLTAVAAACFAVLAAFTLPNVRPPADAGGHLH